MSAMGEGARLARLGLSSVGWPLRSGGFAARDRYSRRVALLRRLLPAIGVSLLLLVLAWPELTPLLDKVRFALPPIDLREARELRMLNPRYAGADRLGRPFVVTAAVARQVPSRDDLVAFEKPHGDLRMHSGMHVVVTSLTGVYQSQTQLLDLFDDVTLDRDDGTELLTGSAHLDVANNTGEGNDPVVGHGPSGDITAQGFRVLNGGNTIIFTGSSDVSLTSAKQSAAPAQPAAMPAAVAETAGRIEAAADVLLAAAPAVAPPAPAAKAAPRHAAAAPRRAAAPTRTAAANRKKR
ncbi:MAG TPA: LPS export ABC transporter periplasmic protein LptC [Stellaceae bacterium]|nr:LPS export ABC transporter periplasmic protein LptC [Stellaceae bacterium]